jgi:hypothetical protein
MTRLLPAALGALLCAAPAAAQTAPADLRQRMRQFEAAGERGEDALIRFFPRNTPLEVVRTPDPDGAAGPTLRRVLAPDSVRAHLERAGTGCAFGGTLLQWADGWRYVGGGRSAARGAHVGRGSSIQWGRERGTWVVRRITEEYHIPRRLLGTAVGELSRDTTAWAWLPEERRYATLTDWYRTHQPLTFRERRWVKYGLPRVLDRGALEPLGTFGVVPVFVEKGRAGAAEVLYALVGPGEYQPYQIHGDTIEDICGKWW